MGTDMEVARDFLHGEAAFQPAAILLFEGLFYHLYLFEGIPLAE